jgi:general secretion pathway protein D
VVKQAWKVPFLGDIPLLGWFFRSKSDSTQRTNLLIFVTPHIVTDMDVAAQLQKSLQTRTALEGPKPLEIVPAQGQE